MNNLCFIQARGGSKRFPGKNVALWNGVPMLVDAINKAKATNLFDTIAVSSDDVEILSMAAKNGAMPIWRTPEAASDTATDDDVAREVLSYFPKINIVCKMYPCIPLIDPADIRAAYMGFVCDDNNYDGVYAADGSGKDAGAYYIFTRSAFYKNNTIALDRFKWYKHFLIKCQDINTPEDLEEAKRKAAM